jgi:hypothetical protein
VGASAIMLVGVGRGAFQAGTFGVRPAAGWAAADGLGPDPAILPLSDAEPLGAGLVLGESGGQRDVADDGGGGTATANDV